MQRGGAVLPYCVTCLHCIARCITGGSRFLQGRVYNSSERGTEGRPSMEVGYGEGAVPPPQKILAFFCVRMVSFYAFPVIFIDTVTFKRAP